MWLQDCRECWYWIEVKKCILYYPFKIVILAYMQQRTNEIFKCLTVTPAGSQRRSDLHHATLEQLQATLLLIYRSSILMNRIQRYSQIPFMMEVSFGLSEWEFQIGMKCVCSKELSFRGNVGFSACSMFPPVSVTWSYLLLNPRLAPTIRIHFHPLLFFGPYLPFWTLSACFCTFGLGCLF